MHPLIRSALLLAGYLGLTALAFAAQPPDPPPPGFALVYRGGICVADAGGVCVGGDIMAEAGVGAAIGYMRTSAEAGTVPVYRGTCYSDGVGNCTAWGLSLDVNGTPVGYLATSPPDPSSANNPLTQSGGLLLQNLGGAASAYLWINLSVPAISSLSPTSGQVGRSVTISGSNFGATQGTGSVTFNGVTATPSSWSDTSIVAPVPTGATTGPVVVTVGGLASNGVTFTVLTGPPAISSLSPTSGQVGSSVTISGSNFGVAQGTSTVTFNGVAATPGLWSNSSIAVSVPAGATTGPVVVTVGGVASNGVTFTVIPPPPVISALSPTSGPVGTSVTISGSNFGAAQGTSTVTFNGVTATPTTWSSTSIVASVPTGATAGPVVVTVGGLASNGVTFTVTVGNPLEPQGPPVVFGPRVFTQPNEAVSFLVANPVGPFWLQVSNGEGVQHAGPGQPGMITMQNLVTAGDIRLNGSLVATASDFDHNITGMFGFQKDVTLTSVNTLEVQLLGPVGSFITVEIREADPNPTVSNNQGDLTGENMGDSVALSWAYDDRAAEYVVFRATSLNNPWAERFRLEGTATGGGQVDTTPDARLMDLCYKLEARDAAGLVIRLYEPICVPKFVETQTQSSVPGSSSSIKNAALSPAPESLRQTLANLSSFSFFPASAIESAYNNDLCIVPGNFVTVEIGEANPNPTVSNNQGDLTGENMGDSVALSWAYDDRAAEYVVFRATSLNSPWAERFRLEGTATGGGQVDTTPDARLMDLCYKVEAVDAGKKVVRRYEPICVPKFVEPRTRSFSPRNLSASKRAARLVSTGKIHQVSLASPLVPQASPRNTQGRNSTSPIVLASLTLLAAPEPTDPRANELCFGNPDEEFTDFRSMGNDKSKIQTFLEDRGGFMQKLFRDVRSDGSPNGEPIDAAREIFEASQTYRINPQVLLVTLQKEHRALTRKDKPPDVILKDLAGWDQEHVNVPKPDKSAQEQIWDMAAQFRRDFDRLSQGKTTGPKDGAGWKDGVAKDTQDPLSVIPASKPVAVLYAFTPWVGKRHGGRPGKGGNGAFCQLWEQYKFKRQPVAMSPANPTLVCGPNASVTLTASGGRPGPNGYTWSITGPNLTTTEGVLTVSGANNETAVLKPPTNPGANLSGLAYRRTAHFCRIDFLGRCSLGQLGFFSVIEYGCNDQPTPTCASYIADAANQNSLGCGVVQKRCSGDCTASPVCSGTTDRPYGFVDSPCADGCISDAPVCDKRSSTLIAQQCNPCALTMPGAVVTVTDAAGASVSKTITVK